MSRDYPPDVEFDDLSEADQATWTDYIDRRCEADPLFKRRVLTDYWATLGNDWYRETECVGRHETVYVLCSRPPGADPEADIPRLDEGGVTGRDLVCVYIGVTSHLYRRLRAHSRKWWWPLIDPRLTEFAIYDSRPEAEVAEKDLIREYQPAMNRAGRFLVVG